MNLLADESVDFAIIEKLRNEGWVVYYIKELNFGISDIEVLSYAFENNLLLITEDKDFGELAYRLKYKHKGIFLIRITGMDRPQRTDVICNILIKYYDELKESFSVLTDKNLRIKPK